MTGKRWGVAFLAFTVSLLVLAGSITVIIDPYFHYHKPLMGLEYPLYANKQRYINDGILRHFEYDAIIIGTSMTENFKTSEFDELFGVNSVKVPFSGASWKEINDNISAAVEYNSEIKVVVRGLDYNGILTNPDYMRYDSYPEYLYDDDLLNDVNYFLNKSVLIDSTYNVMAFTRAGEQTTNFDEYSNWMKWYTFGKAAMDEGYDRPKKTDSIANITVEEYDVMVKNTVQNVSDFVEKNPQIEFYIFFTPYSIYYFDARNQMGELERQLNAEKEVIEMLIEYENIHLFSFFDEFEMICDLDNYKDTLHYGEEINSQILVWMRNGEHQLTKDNYEEYCEKVSDFYLNYDYDSLFEDSSDSE